MIAESLVPFDPDADALRDTLERLLARITYKDWSFRAVSGSILITVRTTNSLDGRPAMITHRRACPMALARYDERFHRRWIFEQIVAVEEHEAAEFFQVDGAMPFFPHREDGSVRTLAEAEQGEPVRPRSPITEGPISQTLGTRRVDIADFVRGHGGLTG